MQAKIVHEVCRKPHKLSEVRCERTPCEKEYPKIVTWDNPQMGKIYALVGNYEQRIISPINYCPACGVNLQEEELREESKRRTAKMSEMALERERAEGEGMIKKTSS